MSVDVLVDRNSVAKDNVSTTEKKGYLTTSAKCLSDTGSDSCLSNVTQGMMSLGHKNTCIHTAIGSEDKIIHKMKISLLDNHGVVQNVKPRELTKTLVQTNSRTSVGIIRHFNSWCTP